MPPPLRLIIAALALATASVLHGESAQTIRIGLEGLSTGVLSFVDKEGRLNGFTPELLREMSRDGDIQFELHKGSWTNLLKDFEAGKIDALANVTFTEERALTMDFSIAHATMHGVVYVRDDQPAPHRSSELAGKRIGARSGTLEYLNLVHHHGWNGTIVPFNGKDELFAALARGDIDVALLTRRLTPAEVKQRGLSNAFLEDVIHSYHFAVHKGDAARLAQLNQALARVLHDCTFDRIYDRWVGPSEPHQIRVRDLRPFFLPAGIVAVALILLFYWQRRVIAQRVAQAARLSEAEERYRGLVESAFDGSVIHQDGLIKTANGAYARMFGYAPEELADRTLAGLISPGTTPGTTLNPWTTLGPPCQSVGLRKDGARINVETATKACTHQGRPAFITVVRDITQRVQAELTLRESEAMFRGVFDASPIPIQLSDAEDARLLEVNSVTLELFGYTRAEVIGQTVAELGTWVSAEQLEEFRHRVRTERLVRAYEATLRTKAGVERIMLCTGALITIAGRPRLLTSQVEITAVRRAEAERAQIQARLLLGQKYEALGTLAGGVAHDFNNILTGVINYAQLAELDCPPTHPQIREFLVEVLNCANRAKELVRQILLFSRSEESERGPLLLQHVVKDTLSLLRSTIPATVEIRTELAHQAPVVLANATQIHQVVMNLAINAAQALPPRGGLITIRLLARQVEAAEAAELHDLAPGPCVVLEVADNGCGMDPALLERIFEPFFTTKKKGEGTGLGLAVVRSVVRSHEGAIRVRSAPGAGTTFELFFPAHTPVAAHGGPATPELPRGRGQRILVVEDEAPVAKSLRILLERLGYAVVVQSDPEQARRLFTDAPASFDLVLTDFQMPGMTGLDLAEKLRAAHPTIPILIASGFTGQFTHERMQALGIFRLLNKPLSMSELAEAIAAALAPA